MVNVPMHLLREANHMTLMQAGNEAYMQLFTTKLRLEVELASKECVFEVLNHIYTEKINKTAR